MIYEVHVAIERSFFGTEELVSATSSYFNDIQEAIAYAEQVCSSFDGSCWSQEGDSYWKGYFPESESAYDTTITVEIFELHDEDLDGYEE